MYVPIPDTDLIQMYIYMYCTFWFLIISMKTSIFSIIMSIIKAINDAIFKRNDIIGTLITLLLKFQVGT